MAAVIAEDRLKAIFETPKNLYGQLSTVDHKEIGIRYMWTTLLYFAAAGIMALVMRTQLATPENTFVSEQTYNQLFTSHGTVMIFFFITPMWAGFANFFVPLQIGARDMAFPRMNALSYWLLLLSGAFFFGSFAVGQAPAGGWFAYTPLTEKQYLPDLGIDFWSLGLMFLTVSSTVGGINLIVTILKMRCPGMSLNRLPMWCWSVLVTQTAIIFAYPALTCGNIFLEADRLFGTRFFDPTVNASSSLLWQQLFWLFGHPDVYIILLPALGVISSVIPVMVRRKLVAHEFAIAATVTLGILSFGVWVHHMFATGLPALALGFFSGASFLVTLPSTVQLCLWAATIWAGRKPIWNTAFLYSVGFLVEFVVGGLTGIMFAAVPFDQQVTDTYFVVAHFHYTLIGGAVFPMLAAFYYWIPKMAGKMMNETLGKLSFWLFVLGFNATFFTMHFTGMMGMPRRVYTYPPGLGWELPNLISTVGSYILGASVLVTVANFFYSKLFGEDAGPDPWGGETLEWATSSHPEPFNFRTIPVIWSRSPLWDQRDEHGHLQLEGIYNLERETPGSDVLDGKTESMLPMPSDSLFPLTLAIGIGCIFTGLLLGHLSITWLGAGIAVVSVGGWNWPRQYIETKAAVKLQ